MIEIKSGTLEERIVRELQRTYPITVSVLAERLGISRKMLLIELKKMQSREIIMLEPLPDKMYIRLLRSNFYFVGKGMQRRLLKRKLSKKQKKEDNGVMYV